MILSVPGRGPAVENAIRDVLPEACCATSLDRVEVIGVDRSGVQDLSDAEYAALARLAYRSGWSSEGSAPRLHALLSPTQRATPLDELAWPTLRGVDEIPEIRQGLWRRRLIVAASDVGTSPLGEAALAPGAVAAIVVEYRYRLVGLGIVEEQARVRYPLADGSGDAYVTEPQTTTLKGAETIGAGRERRGRATTRAGYLLAAGAVAHAQDPTHDPGPQVTHILGGLSTLAGYDLVAAFERSGDPTVLAGLADYTGGHDAWLDLDLGGVTARALALAELAEPTTDGDGWTAWPS